MQNLKLKSQNDSVKFKTIPVRRGFLNFDFLFFNFKFASGGFTLIEIVVYIAILAVLAVVAVNTILLVRSSLNQIKAVRTLSQTETLVLSRITRAVRDAKAVNATESIFNLSPGMLSLTGSENPPITRVFFLSGGALELTDGSNPAIALTPPGVSVTSLIFRHLQASTTSEAVKI